MIWTWAAAALGLGVTILCCFLIFETNSEIHDFEAELLKRQYDPNNEEYEKIKEQSENKIIWFNRFKITSFGLFSLSILTMLALVMFVNMKH